MLTIYFTNCILPSNNFISTTKRSLYIGIDNIQCVLGPVFGRYFTTAGQRRNYSTYTRSLNRGVYWFSKLIKKL